MFYRLLSWKNPRATGIAFASTVVFIFAARYLNVIRYALKLLYLTLGATVTAEVAGQLAFGRGLTSQFRPRQYFTVPKASLERLLDDVEQIINFVVIESQRIVFAENVYASGAVSALLVTSSNKTLLTLNSGFLRLPHFLLPHQVRPSLGIDLDRDRRHVSRPSRLHSEQGGYRCAA
jgi:ABC-type multidrug transport system fused ATPase/permease subunit